jgi:hypothetical protein
MKHRNRPTVLALAVALGLTGLAQAQTTGTPTPGTYNHNPAEYRNNANHLINAAAAYARGWTGRGSTVLIMDTGINLNHPDFAGKIKYSRDFMGTGLGDTHGHGTHLAGIVAASRNGSGIHGVAFDANLAIAKIANNGTLNWKNANGAMAWASQYQDVVVANLSANSNYHKTYTDASRQVSPGLWINTHATHGGKNYYNLETPTSLTIPRNMVLTVSAGNNNTAYVQNPATFAVATDAAGNLVHGGRMLVVGQWNSGREVIEGALSGHMCKDYRSNMCHDRYRMSDFYILAPGSGVISASNTGTGTRNMGGTSQSAAVAAGAVAVINQMWPYMTPENQVQVLLRTANKNLRGYNVNTHGQGLLDLDRATQPIGAVGISTTGRTGTAAPITSIAIAGSTTTVAGRLSSVSVVDDMQRDFTADLRSTVQQRGLITHAQMLDHEPGQAWSARLANVYTWQMQGYSLGQSGTNVSLSLDSRSLGRAGPVSHQITMTNTTQNPWITYSGAWGTVTSASVIEYNYLWRPAETGAWLQAGAMQTASQIVPGMVQNIAPIYAVHATVGYRTPTFSVFGGIQPYIVSGHMDLQVPTSVNEQGVMHYEHSRANLRDDRAVGFAGATYRHQIDRTRSFTYSAVANQTGTHRAEVRYTHVF